MAIFKSEPSKFWTFWPTVPKSPTHTVLICVKAPEPNISCLGPLNTQLYKPLWGGGWSHFKLDLVTR